MLSIILLRLLNPHAVPEDERMRGIKSDRGLDNPIV
jgi:hypothetical protein